MCADSDTRPGAEARGSTRGTDRASDGAFADGTFADGTFANVRGAFTEAARISDAVRRLAWIRWRRLQLHVRHGVFLVLCGVWLTLIAVVASIAAAIRLVNGVAAALASASGRPWVGDLAGGAIVLTLIAGGAWLCYRAVSRRSARETQRRLSRDNGHVEGT